MENNSEQPAFPEPFVNDPRLAISHTKGLTKREYFAGLAMQAYISMQPYSETKNYGNTEHVIKKALEYADELLKQLSKPNKV